MPRCRCFMRGDHLRCIRISNADIIRNTTSHLRHHHRSEPRRGVRIASLFCLGFQDVLSFPPGRAKNTLKMFEEVSGTRVLDTLLFFWAFRVVRVLT